MLEPFPLSKFNALFPTDDSCLDAIVHLRYPEGITCSRCKTATTHYKVTGRCAYSCRYCRTQTSPLKGTLFEKSSTPLRVWFYALFLMTQMRAKLSVIELQNEIGVTYKTAWRMHHLAKALMEKNGGDLLREPSALIKSQDKQTGTKIFKWVLFNAIEVKVVHRQEPAQ